MDGRGSVVRIAEGWVSAIGGGEIEPRVEPVGLVAALGIGLIASVGDGWKEDERENEDELAHGVTPEEGI